MNRKITIANVEIPSRFFLAPMAGYTDYVFRRLSRRFGAGLLVTELVSAAALARMIKKTYRYMEHKEDEYPISLQIFGNKEDDFKKAIELTDLSGFSFIDINMGCPTKKVVRNNGGAGLLSDTDKMVSILNTVKSVSPLPVSVKIRLGFQRGEGGEIERALALKENGAVFLTLHGRYASDLYRGVADWEAIAKVKEALGDDYILIGNGDIKTKEDAKRAFEISKVDGIMVGRAAIGNPWVFRELNTIFDDNSEYNDDDTRNLKDILIEHINGCCELYGEVSGIHFMRKFIMKYLTGFRMDKKIEFMKCENKNDLFKLIDEVVKD
ncbi:tRNA-dihydrouridine synthase family protein [Brachyspira pilosicoli]|uniref:tRNA-dihydrouridine synthase n=1 Tax=Brachyspira pilosicoli TaxID=52584 RepID=A0AAJ6G9C9_BRAPL|nr:tRNA-dihydrouridine synthase family protein [Brachyspira pilosicoli]WIH91131.1 tRNA-dihydrouridine synthase family protein [Brachyspira pilosicoli]WIH93422.1 tRNA-dihydrouridine synthase family protein [Brachyspira pilosicoli]WIH95712.1 tRNA-dihydrouridine synthase family protein [Brachyspira pilosicoli]